MKRIISVFLAVMLIAAPCGCESGSSGNSLIPAGSGTGRAVAGAGSALPVQVRNVSAKGCMAKAMMPADVAAGGKASGRPAFVPPGLKASGGQTVADEARRKKIRPGGVLRL